MQRMKLRTKTIITVSIGVFLLILTVYGLLAQQTLQAAEKLEQSELSRNMVRAKNAVLNELRQLQTITLDWGVYDDAYDYARGRNPDFEFTSLVGTALSVIDIDYAIIQNTQNQVLISRRRTNTGAYESGVGNLESMLEPSQWVWKQRGRFIVDYGIVYVNQQLFFIAQTPIIPASSVQEPSGKLTFVRKFDLVTLAQIEELAQMDIRVYQDQNVDSNPLEQKAGKGLRNGQQNVFLPSDENNLLGFTQLAATQKNGILMLQVENPRNVYRNAIESTQRLAWSSLLIGILVIALILALLEFGILSRLTGLHRDLTAVAAIGDTAQRVNIRGTDEIADLATQINAGLSRIEETQIRSVQLESRLQRLRNVELEANLEATRLELFERLARVAEFRDNETSLHTSRVGDLAAEIAAHIGMGDLEVERIRYAARLHDIGKIAIPDSILFKPATLEREEWTLMQSHAALGAQMLEGSGSPLLEMAQLIAMTHHERWDGSGYPRNLERQDIPLVGRIVGVADTFDALISPRPYKKAWTREAAITEIIKERDKLFDPVIVDALLQILPKFESQKT